MVAENGQKQKINCEFQSWYPSNSDISGCFVMSPVWDENLKDDDFEIHNLFLCFTVLGDHWELEARTGTVRKLSFYTFWKYKCFSFVDTCFRWKMCKTKRPLPQNLTFSEWELAKSKGKCLKKSNISILARCTGTKIDMRWEEVLRVNCTNFGANISCRDICDEKSLECLCLQGLRED